MAAVAVAGAVSSHAAITGQWDFTGSNPLAGSVGSPIEYADGATGPTSLQTQFGTASSFGLPAVNGVDANVMKFGVNSPTMGYAVTHNVPANGNGLLANQYTIIMDVLFPSGSNNRWRALYQTDSTNPSNDDAEFYLDESNRLGIGSYSGLVPANTWVRLVFAADLAAASPTVTTFINGQKVLDHGGALDGRFGLTPEGTLLLFTDGYDNGIYTAPGYLNSLQIHDARLPDSYLIALGGPSGEGIATVVQARAFVRSVTPIASQTAAPSKKYTAILENADTQIDVSSLKLYLDDVEVTPTIQTAGVQTTVSYSGTGLFAPGSTHSWDLVYTDNGVPPLTRTSSVEIKVANYSDLRLPTPIIFENFDSTEEGSLPPGWTERSFTEVTNSEEDFANLDSASYARWTVINSDRFKGSFVTYSNPDNPQDWEDDYKRVLAYNPVYVVNGEAVEQIGTGKIMFGNSGYRNGASQVLYLFTPDFDLTGKNDIHLVFHNLWEQNQDSLAAVEYSIDAGATWQPILYMLEPADVVRDAGNAIDALATFTQVHGDTALYTDPDTTLEVGGNYGDFIGVSPDRWNTLAPYISPRAQDVATESKRVEVFRLPLADNQSKVRFRFAHAGTDSWYFGFDNFGLYSITSIAPPTIATEPSGVTAVEGERVRLAVVPGGTGPFTYEWYRNNSLVPNSNSAELIFDRVTPLQAGEYYVKVRNAGGPAESKRVTVVVNPRPLDIFGVWQFNGDFSRAAGGGSLVPASSVSAQQITFEAATIDNLPAQVASVPAFSAGAHGLHLAMPTTGNGGGEYLNQYTFVWDIFIPEAVSWTPLFNTEPSGGNDADFYVSDAGALGIGALGYSPGGLILPDTWYRIAFTADLPRGEVIYYINGTQVHKRTGGSLAEGRFALYTGTHTGADVLLFSEPTGDYNHALKVNSMLFVDRALTPDEITALNGPKARGLVKPLAANYASFGLNNSLQVDEGTGDLAYASPITATRSRFQAAQIGGAAATVIAIDALPAGKHGLHLTVPTRPNGGGGYLNDYSIVTDIFLPGLLNWTPIFNTNPDNGNDADLYVDPTGALGIGALGYSRAGVIQPNTWHRVAFVANAGQGTIRYYVDGEAVHAATAVPVDGRFSLYTGTDAGPDLLFFSEPSGDYTHDILVNNLLFLDRPLRADELARAGLASAGPISFDNASPIRVSISRSGQDIQLSWQGGQAPFTVERTASLTTPNWVPIVTGRTTSTFVDRLGENNAYYRVVSE